MVAVNPLPENKVATSSILSFLVGSPAVPSSENAIESPEAIDAAVNAFISTSITALAAVNPLPENKVANASVVVFCSVAPSLSRVAKKSPVVGTTVENSEKSTVKVASPVVAPPDNPTPATTDSISPLPPDPPTP